MVCAICILLILSTLGVTLGENGDLTGLASSTGLWQADPLVKRGYILHNIENGNPRYTTLVRRNFLRFGKRGDPSMEAMDRGGQYMADPQVEAMPLPPVKRTRNFIRFGKRAGLDEEGGEEEGMGNYEDDTSGLTGKKEERMRRVSNFLRFGKRSELDVEDDDLSGCLTLYPASVCNKIKRSGFRDSKKMKQFLRFGR